MINPVSNYGNRHGIFTKYQLWLNVFLLVIAGGRAVGTTYLCGVDFCAMSTRRKIDPAIAKPLAEKIRAIGKTAKSEEDVRLNVEGRAEALLGSTRHFHATRLRASHYLLKGTAAPTPSMGSASSSTSDLVVIATDSRARSKVIEQLSGYLAGQAREYGPKKPIEADQENDRHRHRW